MRSVAAQGDQREMGRCHKVPISLWLSWLGSSYCHSVFDSDGEFLLIEAAEALPSWVTPTNAKNRVRAPVIIFTLLRIEYSIGLAIRIPSSPHSSHTRLRIV